MSKKQEAIEKIIAIMKSENISLDELASPLAITAQSSPSSDKASGLMRVMAYLGGVFVIAGISVYIGMYWGELNSLMRVIITLGTGFACYLGAIAATHDDTYKVAIAPLFILAAILQCIGLSVFLYEYFPHSNQWELAGMFVFGILLLQNILTFFGLKRTELLFFSLLFGASFAYAFLEWLKVSDNLSVMLVGLSLLTIVSMLENTRYTSTSPFWFFVSSTTFLCGLFNLVEKSYFEFFFLLVSCFLVYLSVWMKSRTLLFVSTVSIFCYIGYFTAQHFVNSIGWPLALIVLGLLLFALSAVAYKINKYYILAK